MISSESLVFRRKRVTGTVTESSLGSVEDKVKDGLKVRWSGRRCKDGVTDGFGLH